MYTKGQNIYVDYLRDVASGVFVGSYSEYRKERTISLRDIKEEPITCKKFGCGKILTHTENLYSDYCFKHQREINQNKTI